MKVAKADTVDTPTTNKPSANQDVLISRTPSEVLWSEGERFHGLFDDYLDSLGKKEAGKRVAVEMSDSTVSFAALNALANRIAQHLISKDVKPGDKVAILFDRTPEAYASVLAISKVGAVFVPLDRSFPADRVAFIIEDSSAKTVLSLTVYSTVFKDLGVEFIALDASEDEIAKLPATAPAVDLSDTDALAYVIYTSGTTGKPKGVQINHSSMCNFIRVAINCYEYSPDDRVYQSLTLAFDYSFEEIWVPLFSGARLVPAPSGVNLVGQELHEFLLDKKISAYCSVPTILATIDDELPDLKLLLVSGEACPQDLARRWATESRRVLNVYGPTETCVTATWGEIDPTKEITIGEPLPTYSVVILEPDSTKVMSRGEVGEIVIAGVGVGVGYLNRDKETEQAFIPDTVGMPQNPGGTLYRSGDLGRITEDGQIEYQGRADTQVKIRGYRIELAEIEEVAREVSGINSFVVNPWESETGTELVAYFAADDDADVEISNVHQALSERLPPYMVPNLFERLESLPLQTSGKIDRRALPEPTASRLTDSGEEFVAPAHGLESDLAEILAGVLKLERVSADADFFGQLGADSLTMARYLGAVRKKLKKKKASMVLVYENPSIQALAAALTLKEAEAAQAAKSKKATPRPTDQVSDKTATNTAASAGAQNASEVTTQTLTQSQIDPSSVVTPITAQLAASSATSDQPLANSNADRNTAAQSAEPASIDNDDNEGYYGPVPQSENWVASRLQHVMCGVMQVAYMFVMAVMLAFVATVALKWLIASDTWTQMYLRSVGSSVFLFISLTAFSIAVKYLAVGRFTKTEIPLWTVSYVRFWIAKTAIRSSPMIAFVGTPLYNTYLRLLGAKIGKGTLIFAQAPVCTDLLTIGDDTLIRQDSIFNGYTVHRGWLRTGSVDIGDRVYIGEQTVLDIDTRIGDDSQLGNSSCLQSQQEVPSGEKWHGTPARPTDVNYDRVEPQNMSRWAGHLYTAGSMVSGFLVMGPITFILGYFILTALFPVSATAPSAVAINFAMVPLFALALYLGAIILGMLTVVTMPKIYNYFFKPDQVHKLFGVQYWLAQSIAQTSNSIFLHSLWGDSSMIMPYFKAVGYDLSTATQNGSNFGVEQIHHSPFLCKFNRNTLVSDGLYMLNMDMSTTSFKMSQIEVPADAYLGNDLRYPVDAKVGADCMIATKAMLPIEGEVYEGVGILGSPPIQIPRSVARDGRFDHYKKPGIFESRLAMKLKSNVITLGLFMLRSFTSLVVITMVAAYFLQLVARGGIPSTGVIVGAAAATMLFSLFFVPLYNILWERAVLLWYPVKPRVCSLYERPFWNHERFWKMNINLALEVFNGTPLKAFMVRLQGAKVGRMVFDNGAGITEPSTVEIGDYACMNYNSAVQGHSLEDGTFKSDAISIGNRSTIGVSGFIHYGAVLDDDAIVEAHCFLMKGSIVGEGERWGGNPAQPVGDAFEHSGENASADSGAGDATGDKSAEQAA